MAFKQSEILHTLFHLLLFFSLSSSKSPSDLNTICNSTLYPSFCNSILTETNLQTNTIHEYGRFFINQSLHKTNNFKLLVNEHLQLAPNNKHAIKDCHFLANLNINFLSTIANIIKLTNYLSKINTNEILTLLSAAMTNLDTCSSGLKEARLKSSVVKDLSSQISNYTMLLSLSLAFFTAGWVPEKNPNDYLSLKSEQINGWDSDISDSRRRLLQVEGLGSRGILVKKMVVVNPDGRGDFITVNDAVKAAPKNSKLKNGYFAIYVMAGVYEEYVNIPSHNQYVLMIGDGINKTIITGNHSIQDGWTTYRSATFVVTGKGFIAMNLTVRNTSGPQKYQAVALRSDADLSTFYRCSFEGYQDTLYIHSMRQFFKECDIYGTVDFICGNAATVLQNCNIYARQPLEGQTNTITAQSRTDPNQNTGFSIHNSKIMGTNELLASVKTYLGRPWKEYSRTVFMQSFMDNLIDPAGWLEWSGSFGLNTLYYGEFNNNGDGANTTNRVNWAGFHVINETIASYFTVSYLIVGDFWLPSGIPCDFDL